MLDTVMAQRLAEKIMLKLGCNINIMNDKGIIIASGDSKRIGDFHEIAYRIIRDRLDLEIIREGDTRYIGVKPGVNMSIVYEDRLVGVLGISGDPEKILDFARLVKMSVETMVEYELYKKRTLKRQNNKNSFLNALLFEAPFNAERVAKLADKLGYEEGIMRVPLVISSLSPDEIDAGEELIKGNPLHSKQDFLMLPEGENRIVVFKAVASSSVQAYKELVCRYAGGINNSFRGEKSPPLFYAGSIQEKFSAYRQAYRHALWLEKSVGAKGGQPCFFTDHITRFLQEAAPFETYKSIFSVYEEALDKMGGRVFIETAEALLENNMSIRKTAEQLYLHRNTVLFRLKKIREALGVEPSKSASDFQFILNLLHFYRASI